MLFPSHHTDKYPWMNVLVQNEKFLTSHMVFFFSFFNKQQLKSFFLYPTALQFCICHYLCVTTFVNFPLLKVTICLSFTKHTI